MAGVTVTTMKVEKSDARMLDAGLVTAVPISPLPQPSLAQLVGLTRLPNTTEDKSRRAAIASFILTSCNERKSETRECVACELLVERNETLRTGPLCISTEQCKGDTVLVSTVSP